MTCTSTSRAACSSSARSRCRWSRSCSRRSASGMHLRPAPKVTRGACSSASTRSAARSAKAAWARCTARQHMLLRRPTAIKLMRARSAPGSLDALRARGAADERSSPTRTPSSCTTTAAPRRRLLLRDGVPRRRHRPRRSWSRSTARSPPAGSCTSSRRCAARSPRRTRARPDPPRHQAREHHPVRARRSFPTSRRSSTSASSRRSRREATGRRPQVIVGTPHYLSPEQLLGPAEVGPRGRPLRARLVGYELLTGKTVFDGQDRGRWSTRPTPHAGPAAPVGGRPRSTSRPSSRRSSCGASRRSPRSGSPARSSWREALRALPRERGLGRGRRAHLVARLRGAGGGRGRRHAAADADHHGRPGQPRVIFA